MARRQRPPAYILVLKLHGHELLLENPDRVQFLKKLQQRRPNLRITITLEFVSSFAEFPSAMNFCGRWFIGFGFFLFVCGLAGFLSNPSGAKTALISGGTFGFLSALSGVLMSRGLGWAWMAALGCTGFLAAVFTWRAAAGWMAYSAGQPKLFVASLITLMLAGSLISIGVLVKNRHRR